MNGRARALLLLACAGVCLAAIVPALLGGAGASGRANADALRRRLARVESSDRKLDDLLLHEEYVAAFAVAIEETRSRFEELGPDDPATLDALERVGSVAHSSGAQDLADELFEIVAARRRVLLGPQDPAYARALYHRGVVARYLGEFDFSRECFEQALAILARRLGVDPGLEADLIQAQANWLRRLDLAGAIERYRQALDVRLADSHAAEFKVADNLVWLGWSLHQLGRHDEALETLDRAESRLLALGLGEHTLMGVIGEVRANRLAIAGEWEAAGRVFAESGAILEGARRKHFPGLARRKSLNQSYEGCALARLMQPGGAEEEEAWQLLQRARGATSDDHLRLAHWRETAPQSYLAVAELRRAALDARRDLLRMRSAPDFDRAAEWTLLLRELELEARAFRLEQEYLDGLSPVKPTLDELRRALGPREAYVGWEYFRLADQHGVSQGPVHGSIWCYVVRPQGVRWVLLVQGVTRDETRRFEHAIARYVESLRGAAGWPERVERDDELIERGRLLGAWVVGPVLPLLDGVDTLIVSMSRVAPELPVESLPLEGGATLEDRYRVAYVPSAESYLALRARNARHHGLANRPALVLGDPRFVGGDDSTLPGLFEPLTPLPFSGREIESIAALFPAADLFRGDAATEAALAGLARTDGLRRYGAVHIATHVVQHRQLERCALAMSRPDPAGYDGLVHPAEIFATWRLEADVVTLSGCQSVVGRGMHDRGEYLGFTQVLLAAGAGSVVASRWNVDDEATALLMTRFYENLTGRYRGERGGATGPLPRAQALQEASLWLRDHVDDAGRRPFEHPVHWAGFMLIGPPS